MGGPNKVLRLLAAPMVLVAVLAIAGPASADLAQLKASCTPRDALDNNTGNGSELPYAFCDDGTGASGGRDPNPGAVRAIAVPAAYQGATGLPAKDSTAAAGVPGNAGGEIALDADLSLPDPAKNPMPTGGYPLVVFMHGCCGGNRKNWESSTIEGTNGSEHWHHNNAWFAARGYAVVNYTSRGFVNARNPDGTGEDGSTGEMQLDSTRFEINDYQHLAGQLADDTDIDALSPGAQKIDPQKIVPAGGSYGGGFAWLALTDPDWKSPAGKDMRVAAVATKYGWTSLVESLVPNGADRRDALPSSEPETAAQPLGAPKRSINAGLYATGILPTGNHTTFPQAITEAQVCLSSGDPFELNPLCKSTLANLLPRFVKESSAYYQNGFFRRLQAGTTAPVPVFSAGTFTDPLFPTAEHRRMAERLKASVAGYPIQEYYGDYQHFTQNKRKEWSDLCGADHHVCTYADYPLSGAGRDLNATPASLVREHGVNTRINRFLDHYVKPPANPTEPKPADDVTASLQTCAENESSSFPLDEPGERFTAGRFSDLAPNSLTVNAAGPPQLLPNRALPNPHAIEADPVRYNNVDSIRDLCPNEPAPDGFATAGPGVATYDSSTLARDFTLVGQPRLTVSYTALGEPRQINARLYDLYPDGKQVLVDRASYRPTAAELQKGQSVLDVRGAGWRFPKGHKLRLEVSQDDDPHIKFSNVLSALVLSSVKMQLPVREASSTVGGTVPPSRNGGGSGAASPGTTLPGGGRRITGSRGNDRIVGTPGDDVIFCGDGDDRVLGRGGDDYIDCGSGNDTVNSGPGRDRVLGRSGNDFIRGGAGEDQLAGGGGNDRIDARDGADDTIDCGDGEDVAIVDELEDGLFDCEEFITP